LWHVCEIDHHRRDHEARQPVTKQGESLGCPLVETSFRLVEGIAACDRRSSVWNGVLVAFDGDIDKCCEKGCSMAFRRDELDHDLDRRRETLRQMSLNVSQLDPLATDLDLGIHSPDETQGPIHIVSHQVAGPIYATWATTELSDVTGLRDEGFLGFCRVMHISRSDKGAFECNNSPTAPMGRSFSGSSGTTSQAAPPVGKPTELYGSLGLSL
jgi:hypothetical protein